MILQIPRNSSGILAINPTDADGEPAVIDGEPTFTLANEDFGSITVVDGVATFASLDLEGTVDLTVSADVRAGSGINTLSETHQIVVADEATTLGVSFEDIVTP